jgi:hypothetical protein
MQRLLLAFGAAVAAAAFTPLAGAVGSYDQVVGAGTRATDDSSQIVNRFAVQAFDGPSGVSGFYNVHPEGNPSATRRVDIKCTYVAGSRAVVGGIIVDAPNPDLIGIGFAIAFEDNGNPQGGVTPDRVSSNDFFTEPGRTPPLTQADCAAEAASGIFNTFHPMASGDIQIYDAP